MYKIIKANHHFLKIAGNMPPKFIQKLTRSICSLIRPSTSSAAIMKTITEHAQNRQAGLLFFLQRHYKTVIEDQLRHLLTFPCEQWQSLIHIATTWAKTRLNARSLPQIISQTWTLIKARMLYCWEAAQPPLPSGPTGNGVLKAKKAPGAPDGNDPPRTNLSTSTGGQQSPWEGETGSHPEEWTLEGTCLLQQQHLQQKS